MLPSGTHTHTHHTDPHHIHTCPAGLAAQLIVAHKDLRDAAAEHVEAEHGRGVDKEQEAAVVALRCAGLEGKGAGCLG